MSRRPATLLQADVARVIRAAKQAGASEVEVRSKDGTAIVVRLHQAAEPETIKHGEDIIV